MTLTKQSLNHQLSTKLVLSYLRACCAAKHQSHILTWQEPQTQDNNNNNNNHFMTL